MRDSSPTRKSYSGALDDVLGTFDVKTGARLKPGKYSKDAEEADKYDKLLEHIVRTYLSLEFVPAALARQGAAFTRDAASHWTGLATAQGQLRLTDGRHAVVPLLLQC